MLSLSRLCTGSATGISQFFGVASRNINKITPLRNYANLVYKKQQFLGRNSFKAFQPGNGTISLRLASDSAKKGDKTVGYWLLTCSGMVFVGVTLGGVTRLTESGPSVMTWKISCRKKPRTQQEWETEFAKYQQSPEFKYKNLEITLSEFKLLWYVEYGRRKWGKLAGAVFLIPAAYFWATGRFPTSLKKRMTIWGVLLGAQGVISWRMVKSSLKNRDSNDIPRVSPSLLAGYLGVSYFLCTMFLWSGLFQLLPAESVNISNRVAVKASRQFKKLVHGAKGLIFFTAITGALIAGVDAGLINNNFPKVVDKSIPDDSMSHSLKESNLTASPTNTQISHRVLGSATLAFITALWWVSRKRVLPRRAYLAATTLAVVAYAQVAFGITSIVTNISTSTAVSHQNGSLLLMSIAVWLSHELRRLPK